MPIEPREFQFSNFGISTLAGGISGASTTMTVQMNDGQKFPNADATYDEIFTCILSTPGLLAVEIVYVTEVDGDVFTIERGKEGTTARNWDAGVAVVHSVTAQMFNDIVAGGPTPPAENTMVVIGEDAGLIITTDGTTFEQRGFYNAGQLTPATDNWRAIGYSPTLSRLVVTGSTPDVAYSDDGGFFWTLVEDALPQGGAGAYWGDCIWSEQFSLFITCFNTGSGSVGLDFSIATSPDGIVWTARATPFVNLSAGDGVNGLVDVPAPFSKPGIYGVHANDYCYSDDGINYVNIDANLSNGWAANGRTAGMAFSPDAPAMIGGSVEGSSSFPGLIGVSSDGINFTQPNAQQGNNADPIAGAYMTNVDLFVSVCIGSTVNVGSHSSDGASWTTIPLSELPSRQWIRPIWSEIFQHCYALSSSNTPSNALARSADAVTWDDIATPAEFQNNQSWNDGVDSARSTSRDRQELVMVENVGGGKEVATSEDGSTWFKIAAENVNDADNAVAFAPTLGTQGRFCTVGNAGAIATSDDAGATWTDRTPAAVVNFNTLWWDDTLSLFIAGAINAGSTTNIQTSPDGITWTTRTTATTFEAQTIVGDGSGNLVAVGEAGPNDRNAYFSSDGTTWTQCTNDSSISENVCLTYDSTRSRFVTGGVQEEIMVSTDGGDNWTDLGVTLPAGHQLTLQTSFMIYVASVDRLFVTTNQGIISSDDGGATWTERDDTDAGRGLVEMDSGLLISCYPGANSIRWSDDDGVTWRIGPNPIGTQSSWRRMAKGRVLEVFAP